MNLIEEQAGKFARPPTMTTAGHTKAIARLFGSLGKAQPDLIGIEAEIGEHYAAIRRILGYGSDQMRQWVEEKLPGIDARHLRRCVELHQRRDDFEAAHEWYLREGRKIGWRTPHATGCRYALDVIKFHRRHQEGGQPPEPKVTGGTRATSSVAHLTALLDQRDAEIIALKKALNDAEWKSHPRVCSQCSQESTDLGMEA